MSSRIFLNLFFLLMILSNPIWANDDHWQCAAHDNQDKQWQAVSSYERVANNKAFEACKKESAVPASCKPTEDACDYIMNGKSSNLKPHQESSSSSWTCTALDQAAASWVGKTYNNKDDAALNAKTNCQEHSKVPDTCYINLLTCRTVPNK